MSTHVQDSERIDRESGSFTAGGRLYTIATYLNGQRFVEFQICEAEFGLSTSLKAFAKGLQDQRDAFNRGDFMKVAVINENMINGIVQLQLKAPMVLRLCALVCNYEGEDVTKWNEDDANKKIEAFKASPIPIDDFFMLASRTANGFTEAYNNASRTILGTTITQHKQNETSRWEERMKEKGQK